MRLDLHSYRCLVFAAACCALSACKPSMAEDLDKFCLAVNEVARDPTLDTNGRLAAIAAKTNDYSQSGVTGEAELWKKLHAAPLDQKVAILTDTAHASGKNDWKCSSFEKLIITAKAEEAIRLEKERKAAETPDAGVSPDAGTAPASDAKADKKGKKAGKKKKKRKH